MTVAVERAAGRVVPELNLYYLDRRDQEYGRYKRLHWTPERRVQFGFDPRQGFPCYHRRAKPSGLRSGIASAVRRFRDL